VNHILILGVFAAYQGVMHTNAVPIQERSETVPFFWPADCPSPRVRNIESYALNITVDRDAFEAVQGLIEWHVSEEQWQVVSEEIVGDSMVFVTQFGKPIAVACGLTRASGWVELAWVAVAPAHRGLGIGKMVCGAVVTQLLNGGNAKIFGSTQDERLSAIKIYFGVGFYPLYRKDKTERWSSICQKLETPFTPDRWGWPPDA
jgi:GNAT superfamily N-acetyltransferase